MRHLLTRLLIIVPILMFIIFPSFLKAQVTIGSSIPPSKGVLLDFKEIDDIPAQNGGITTNKGLLLPRVKLSNIGNLNDIPNADMTTPKRYTGLFVYNIDSVNVNKGINVWDGAKWVGVQSQSQSQSQLKSFLNIKGGTGSIIADSPIPTLTNWRKIPFPIKEFDDNNEYDNISTYEFVPKQAGTYNIYAQFKISGAVVAGEYSIGIIKRYSNTTTYTLLAEETSSIISVVGINVGTPTRSVETLVKLEAGDAIIIGIKTSLATIILLASSNSYFTVHQVK